jgi:outer membrane protein OmpA-like peptidoglycan-associated protein
MQKLLTCFGLLLAMAAPAQAQELGVDIQLFVPTPSATGFLTVESAEIPEHLGLNFGTMLTYGHGILEVVSVQRGGVEAPIGPVVKNRVDLNLMGSIGLFNWGEVGLVLPLVYAGGFAGNDFSSNSINIGTGGLHSFSQGDLRVVPKLRVWHGFDGLLSIAAVPTVILPTGRGKSLASEAKVALNLGYKLRQGITLGGSQVTIGDELFAKVGLSYAIWPKIELIGEVAALTQAAHPFGHGVININHRAGTPAEADVGVRVIWRNFSFTAGGGGGLTSGYGAPAPRLFLGATYDTGKTVLPDRDHDGIPDVRDKCPDRPEDHDGFEDEDGCPDPDNDHDNIPDEDDQCPNEPEDKDNFQDEDGCPDLDNDHDGVPDAQDMCPDDPEDRDGFEDDDGCPDLDNDKDGIPDALDVCPDAPEDIDGFEDQDGCPDLDNDQDGLPDLNDQCPNFPEDKDGVQDDDGCAEDNDNDGIPDNLDKCPNEPETYNGFEDEDGCPDVTKSKSLVQITDDKIEIKETIYFKAGNAVIEVRSHEILGQVASVMRNFKRVTKLRIEGHTDNTGDRKKNLRLSQDRANAVRKYLVDRGIDAKRLEAVGRGPDRPIASNKTASGRDKNRRVEFLIAQQQQIGEEAKPSNAPAVAPVLLAPAPAPAPPAATPAGRASEPSHGDLLDLSSKRTAPGKALPKAGTKPAPARGSDPKTPKGAKAKKKKDVQFDF